MILSIDHAINILYKMHQHTHSAKEQASLDMGISALMTIKDGNYQPHQDPPTPNKDVPPAIDLKTLYEQTTQYCTLVDTDDTTSYYIEIFHQPETPIYIFVYWNREPRTINSIAYTIKGE